MKLNPNDKPPPDPGYTQEEWDEFLLAIELNSIFPIKESYVRLTDALYGLSARVRKEIEPEMPRPAKQPVEEKKPDLRKQARKARAAKLARHVLDKRPSVAREILDDEYDKPPAL